MSPDAHTPNTGWRARVTDAASGLFRHAPDPLADTFSHPGDPGLFGPGSMTWQLMGDVAAFVGGIRALLVQAAHPEVAAGVGDHSVYREDPLGRLSRTAAYVTATTYGAIPEVDAALAIVRRAHGPVSGTSHRGVTYDAGDPEMGAWVHNALVDSFLTARRTFGPSPVSDADADAYVAEQAWLGERLGVTPLPTTAADLAAWVAGHPACRAPPAIGHPARLPAPLRRRRGHRPATAPGGDRRPAAARSGSPRPGHHRSAARRHGQLPRLGGRPRALRPTASTRCALPQPPRHQPLTRPGCVGTTFRKCPARSPTTQPVLRLQGDEGG